MTAQRVAELLPLKVGTLRLVLGLLDEDQARVKTSIKAIEHWLSMHPAEHHGTVMQREHLARQQKRLVKTVAAIDEVLTTIAARNTRGGKTP